MLAAHLVRYSGVHTVCHGVYALVHTGGRNEEAGIETNHCRVAATDARSPYSIAVELVALDAQLASATSRTNRCTVQLTMAIGETIQQHDLRTQPY